MKSSQGGSVILLLLVVVGILIVVFFFPKTNKEGVNLECWGLRTTKTLANAVVLPGGIVKVGTTIDTCYGIWGGRRKGLTS